MLGLFKKKSNIDEDFFDWAITISKWAIASFDGLEQLQKTPLVTPGISFFPRSELSRHERAVELFDQVKQLADMRDWECELKAHSEQAPHHLGASVMQKYETNRPLGTFSETQTDGRIISTITYEPSLLKRPIDLIATFSHELAHLLMTSATTELPFDEEMHEPATDSVAIMMGFGIFIANGSSGFHTDDQGWEYHRSGYLCEGEILHVPRVCGQVAKKMIHLSGLRYPDDIDIKITGLRPGEKLYEELLATGENTISTYHDKIMIAKTQELDCELILGLIEKLCLENKKIVNSNTVSIIKQLVPEYKSNNSIYEKLDKVAHD